MKLVIACGGTGGHLYPGLAVAEVFQARGHEVLLFISEKEIDAVATKDYAARFRFERSPTIAMPKIISGASVKFVMRLTASVVRCRKIYDTFRPDAVLGMGGFTTTAPLLAGKFVKAKVFVHESNALPGRANQLNARIAQTVLLGFAQCAKFFAASTDCQVTGTPIRDSLREKPDRISALRKLGLQPNGLKTLLIMGGSQGAHGLNRILQQAAFHWKSRLQVIHLTGRDDEQQVRRTYDRAFVPAYVAAFHHRMQEAYWAADFVVARSGAASLTEIAYFGLPSMLIPYPAAAADHQTRNAEIYERAGAALLTPEIEAAPETLAKDVLSVINCDHQLASMSQHARDLSLPDAATRIADTIKAQCRR